jgi:hypothetical protein
MEDDGQVRDDQCMDRSNLFGAAASVKETMETKDVRSIEGKGHGDLPCFEDPSFDPIEYVNQKFSTGLTHTHTLNTLNTNHI